MREMGINRATKILCQIVLVKNKSDFYRAAISLLGILLARDFIGFNNKKGEVYEENFFEKKNPFFKSKAFTDEIKEFYAGKMNEKLKDADYKMQIFDKDEPYLPLKKNGKNNPNEKFIKENNKQRLIWNKNVSVALVEGFRQKYSKK